MIDNRKVRGRGAYGYIETKWVFNAKKGTSRRRLERQVYYHVYGDKQLNPTQQPRGRVYSQSGDVERYGDYKAWALGQSRRQNYLFRTHISPKGHLLSDLDFVTAVRTASKTVALFNEFRLVIHRDTDNAHAHMLFASQRQWRRAELAQWKVAVREQLMEIERAKCMELGIPLPGMVAGKKKQEREAVSAENSIRAKTRPKRRRRRRKQRAKAYTATQTITQDRDDDGFYLDD